MQNDKPFIREARLGDEKAGAKVVTLESSITANDFYKHIGFRDNGPIKHHEIGGSLARGFPMIFDLCLQ